MSEVQIVLIVVSITLTVLLGFIWIQIFLVIREIKKVIQKVNAMLEGKENLEDLIPKTRIRKAITFLRNKLPIRV